MRYTTCCLVCDLWYVYPKGRNQSVSGQVTQLVTPLVHHFLPYFLNNFCSSLHYLTAKMGWYTGMSHPRLFSCCMRNILQQSSKVQAWTFSSLNQLFPQFCAQFYWSCTPPQNEYMFMLSTQRPNYVFIPSINSVVANVLCNCNCISGKQKTDFQL